MYLIPQPMRGSGLRGPARSFVLRRPSRTIRRGRLSLPAAWQAGLGQVATTVGVNSPGNVTQTSQGTVDDAMQQGISGESSPDFQNSFWMQGLRNNVTNMSIGFAPPAGQCTGQNQPNLQLFQQGSQMVLKVGTDIAAACGTGAIAGPIGMVIGGIVGLFSALFAHHAQAVAAEQRNECAAIPAANNYLAVIWQAVSSGQQTPQQGQQALQSLLASFSAQVASSVQHNPCNALCEYIVTLKAIVIYWSWAFGDMATAAAASPAGGVTSSITAAATSLGVSPTLLWLLGGFLVYQML